MLGPAAALATSGALELLLLPLASARSPLSGPWAAEPAAALSLAEVLLPLLSTLLEPLPSTMLALQLRMIRVALLVQRRHNTGPFAIVLSCAPMFCGPLPRPAAPLDQLFSVPRRLIPFRLALLLLPLLL